MGKKCDHIIGYEEYESATEKFAKLFRLSQLSEKRAPEVEFDFCPICQAPLWD